MNRSVEFSPNEVFLYFYLLNAVSYTHLQTNKSIESHSASAEKIRPVNLTIISVSYTHLDVYKRQIM